MSINSIININNNAMNRNYNNNNGDKKDVDIDAILSVLLQDTTLMNYLKQQIKKQTHSNNKTTTKTKPRDSIELKKISNDVVDAAFDCLGISDLLKIRKEAEKKSEKIGKEDEEEKDLFVEKVQSSNIVDSSSNIDHINAYNSESGNDEVDNELILPLKYSESEPNSSTDYSFTSKLLESVRSKQRLDPKQMRRAAMDSNRENDDHPSLDIEAINSMPDATYDDNSEGDDQEGDRSSDSDADTVDRNRPRGLEPVDSSEDLVEFVNGQECRVIPPRDSFNVDPDDDDDGDEIAPSDGEVSPFLQSPVKCDTGGLITATPLLPDTRQSFQVESDIDVEDYIETALRQNDKLYGSNQGDEEKVTGPETTMSVDSLNVSQCRPSSFADSGTISENNDLDYSASFEEELPDSETSPVVGVFASESESPTPEGNQGDQEGRRVRFAKQIVTSVVQIERLAPHEVEEMFYTHSESIRFHTDFDIETERAQADGLTWHEWIMNRTDEAIDEEAAALEEVMAVQRSFGGSGGGLFMSQDPSRFRGSMQDDNAKPSHHRYRGNESESDDDDGIRRRPRNSDAEDDISIGGMSEDDGDDDYF